MDHIKMVIVGLIVTGVVFGIVGLIMNVLGIQQY
jgi:hypothetical protein